MLFYFLILICQVNLVLLLLWFNLWLLVILPCQLLALLLYLKLVLIAKWYCLVLLLSPLTLLFSPSVTKYLVFFKLTQAIQGVSFWVIVLFKLLVSIHGTYLPLWRKHIMRLRLLLAISTTYHLNKAHFALCLNDVLDLRKLRFLRLKLFIQFLEQMWL